MELKFYKVKDTILATDSLQDLGLEEVVPNTVDAAREKHVPHVERAGRKVTVQVGEVLHPMTPEHYITFIMVTTDKGVYKQNLEPGQQPIVDFGINLDEVVDNVYAYCNLHGLWKASV